jgi:hypothetical protein
MQRACCTCSAATRSMILVGAAALLMRKRLRFALRGRHHQEPCARGRVALEALMTAASSVAPPAQERSEQSALQEIMVKWTS